MTAPPGRLFRGLPAYQACTPWGPLPALAVVGVVEGLSFLGVRLLVFNAGMAELLALLISQAVTIILIVTASSLPGGRTRDVLSLQPAGGWRAYAAATMTMVLFRILTGILLAMALAFVLYAGSFDLTADWQRDQSLVQTSALGLQIAAIAIGAPVSEELLYRGFLLSALARTRLGFWGAAVIVTGLWTALHDYSAVGVASVFILGLFLVWLVWRTGSLRVAIFCHALNNALVLAAHQFISLPIPS